MNPLHGQVVYVINAHGRPLTETDGRIFWDRQVVGDWEKFHLESHGGQ